MLKKILFILVIGFAVLFLVSSIAISLFGKKIVQEQASQNLKMPVSLAKISLNLPFSVKLTGLKIGDLFSAEKISFSPNLLGIFAGKILLSGLVVDSPIINLKQSADGKLNLPVLEQKGKQPPILITSLRIISGKIIFTDQKVSPEGFSVVLNNINLKISKVMLPLTSTDIKFDLSANIGKPDAELIGSVDAKGWLNFIQKNMQAVFNLKGFDPVYFSPYLGDNFISAKKLLSAKVNLSSDLAAQNNDLDAKCNFTLSNLVYAPQTDQNQESSSSDITGLLFKNALDLFIDKEGKLNLDFEIKTKLDNPAISPKELRKIILKAAAKNLASQNPEDLADKVQNTIKQFKDIGKQFQGLFKSKKE